jgi:hypothetical protein
MGNDEKTEADEMRTWKKEEEKETTHLSAELSVNKKAQRFSVCVRDYTHGKVRSLKNTDNDQED